MWYVYHKGASERTSRKCVYNLWMWCEHFCLWSSQIRHCELQLVAIWSIVYRMIWKIYMYMHNDCEHITTGELMPYTVRPTCTIMDYCEMQTPLKIWLNVIPCSMCQMFTQHTGSACQHCCAPMSRPEMGSDIIYRQNMQDKDECQLHRTLHV